MNEDFPLPTPGPDTAPYWAGLRERQLLIQKCTSCGKLRHYPRPVCDGCFSMQSDWVQVSGRGTIHSWTRTHHAFLPVFRADAPYILVTVDLEEGPRMNARLRGSKDDPAIGAAVVCQFEPHDENWTFPSFALV
jgi:uncharacterized OB-fold protein